MKKTIGFVAISASMALFGCASSEGSGIYLDNNSATTAPTAGLEGATQPAVGAAATTGPAMMSNGVGNITGPDLSFANDAAQGGVNEVQFGQLVLQKSNNDAVRSFAQKMVDEHTKANEDLSKSTDWRIVSPLNFDADAQVTRDHLITMSGADFDKAYISMMVEDHQKDLAAFQNEADNGTNATVKDFATRTLPMIKAHLEMAKMLAKNIGAPATMPGM